MSKNAPKVFSRSGEIMDELGYYVRESDHEKYIDTLSQYYLMDGGHWRGLDAVALIVSPLLIQQGDTKEDFDGILPQSMIEIPWWALRAIFIAWLEWIDGQEGRRPKMKLGQPLKLNGLSKGRDRSARRLTEIGETWALP